jgi:hypothetical protein
MYLSAIPPDTMVVAVVANDSWKRKVVKTGPAAIPLPLTNQLPTAKKELVPGSAGGEKKKGNY